MGILVLPIMLFVASFLSATVHAGVNDFTVSSFTADYYLDRDAQKASILKVHEKIEVVFPDFDQNHGIERAIPQSNHGHSLGLVVRSVTNEKGSPRHFKSSTLNGNTVVRIGDGDIYLHGRQIFKIEYTMRDVTFRPDNAARDEFYWDINGTEWSQTFESVSARIHIPASLQQSLLAGESCYTGLFGAAGRGECMIERYGTSTAQVGQNTSTVITAETTKRLSPQSTMTVAVAFKPGTFAEYAPPAWERFWPYVSIIGILAPPIVAIIIMSLRWRKLGRDPKGRGTIIPEYVTPKGVGLMEAATVYKQSFSSTFVTAQIIDLAVRGYIKIYETKEVKKFARDSTNYEVELVRSSSDLRSNEQEVVSMLFGTLHAEDKRVSLKSLSTKMYKKVERISSEVTDAMVKDGYFLNKPSKVRHFHISQLAES